MTHVDPKPQCFIQSIHLHSLEASNACIPDRNSLTILRPLLALNMAGTQHISLAEGANMDIGGGLGWLGWLGQLLGGVKQPMVHCRISNFKINERTIGGLLDMFLYVLINYHPFDMHQKMK